MDKLQEIETNINYFLDKYDKAVKEGNQIKAIKLIKIIDYELNKLDENEITINSNTFLN